MIIVISYGFFFVSIQGRSLGQNPGGGEGAAGGEVAAFANIVTKWAILQIPFPPPPQATALRLEN